MKGPFRGKFGYFFANNWLAIEIRADQRKFIPRNASGSFVKNPHIPDRLFGRFAEHCLASSNTVAAETLERFNLAENLTGPNSVRLTLTCYGSGQQLCGLHTVESAESRFIWDDDCLRMILIFWVKQLDL